MMAEMAEAIGRDLEAQNYRARQRAIRKAFRGEYLGAEGRLTVDTQTAHVLALDMDMVAPEQRPGIAARLAGKIAQNDHRMATGFLGTKPLLPVLSANGQHDLAVRLFQSRRYPSWGYEVVNGATTVWERWDSYTVEHGFNGESGSQNASMNSFSHYSFGAVAEWMFRDLVGIRSDGPGFKRVTFRPGPPSADSNPEGEPIHWARAQQDSLRGRIACKWRREGARLVCDFTVPANVTATALLPTQNPHRVTEGGRALGEAPEVSYLGLRDDRVAIGLGSGTYRFSIELGDRG
jgi:alpha-L-rhamnosidase